MQRLCWRDNDALSLESGEPKLTAMTLNVSQKILIYMKLVYIN